MKSFNEWLEDQVFPSKPQEPHNPENKQTMVRIERHTKYTQENGLDGGDIFFFDTWEEALDWMKGDYYEYSGGWSVTRDERVAHNMEHGIHYKAVVEFGNAQSHSEWGY